MHVRLEMEQELSIHGQRRSVIRGRKSSGARMSGQEDLEKKTFEPIDLQ